MVMMMVEVLVVMVVMMVGLGLVFHDILKEISSTATIQAVLTFWVFIDQAIESLQALIASLQMD